MISDNHLCNRLREVVSIRAGGHCEWPGCYNSVADPHHVYSRENKSIRYDPDACIYLCAEHHTGGNDSAHRAPLRFKQIMIENCVRSEDWWDQVTFRAHQVVKADKYFREMWKYKLEEELRRLAA